MEIKKQTHLSGELTVPGDKSISHRAVMFGSLAQGTTKITHFLEGADCLSTISCFQKMGIDIERNASEILVHGKGLHGLNAPSEILDVGNSGTTTRLISGILAGQAFTSELNGDASIQSRPMKRIMTPRLSMGADITLLNASTEGEPTADLLIRTSSLHGTTVEGEIIPTLIDEIPMIAVMAAFAEGTTVIKDAQELKVKESDRIAVVTEGLKRMGADIQPTDDGMIIHGGKPLHGAEINSYLDHRIAMSFAVAGTICDGTLTIKDGDCVKISYPEFYEDLYSLEK